MDEEKAVYLHMEYYSAIKRNGILSLAEWKVEHYVK
jgi:hypothetical protein